MPKVICSRLREAKVEAGAEAEAEAEAVTETATARPVMLAKPAKPTRKVGQSALGGGRSKATLPPGLKLPDGIELEVTRTKPAARMAKIGARPAPDAPSAPLPPCAPSAPRPPLCPPPLSPLSLRLGRLTLLRLAPHARRHRHRQLRRVPDGRHAAPRQPRRPASRDADRRPAERSGRGMGPGPASDSRGRDVRRVLRAAPRLWRQGCASSHPARRLPPLQPRAHLPARWTATRAAGFGVEQ